MPERITDLHLSLAGAARAHGSLVAQWLRNAGSASHDALIDPSTCEQSGIDKAQAENWLAPPDPVQKQSLEEHGWQSIALGDADYPDLLACIEDPPAVLFIRGQADCLNGSQVALVGSRHASLEGRENAFAFARALARAGFLVTSGLALGIDGAAHRGALEAGSTLAVLGCGPDRVYPPRHGELAQQITRNGALVTEFPPGTPPLREHFPRRNRIISGLSLATVVVEAAPRSGSLITARLAAEQGREVFAVPGSIHNPMSKGCHRLLRDGAAWLEDLSDLMDSLGTFEQLDAVNHRPAPDEPLLASFTPGLNRLEQLQARTGLPLPTLNRELTRLEMEGWIERLPGGYQKGGLPVD